MRKKFFIKIGIYSYIILLSAGVSYALFSGDVMLEGTASAIDMRPPPAEEPDLEELLEHEIESSDPEKPKEEEPQEEEPQNEEPQEEEPQSSELIESE